MDKKTTDLSSYDHGWYTPGPLVKRGLWYFTSAAFFLNPFFPFSGPKKLLLRLFGAKLGRGVIIKPSVNIKYPWLLSVGDHAWLGEGAWLDNLASIQIGDHCCISQGALLLCGNHDYKKPTFDLFVRGITLENGAWVGAKAVVCPGVTLRSHSILTAGSVATSDLDAYGIYSGNPAAKVRDRELA